MRIEGIRSLVAADLEAVDELILDRLKSDVVLINQIGSYIVGSGGKRLRPLLVLLCARALGYEGRHHINLAAVIEFIHTATLLHDDVVDNSSMRRTRETANAVWGNSASVLVGDFLYSRAFEMMVELDRMPVMDILSHATNRIAEGEVLQLLNCHNPTATEGDYLQVILRKTATLFEAGAELGAVLAGAGAEVQRRMADYGRHLGIAFQLVDDVLDYSSTNEVLGKNVGDDLAEGKPTLPLIQAMRQGTPEQADLIREVIEKGDTSRIEAVMKVIESTKAITYTARLARGEAEKAKQVLGALAPSAYCGALLDLADFSVSRTY
jgi:octaprenyl-diphosphate synthase